MHTETVERIINDGAKLLVEMRKNPEGRRQSSEALLTLMPSLIVAEAISSLAYEVHKLTEAFHPSGPMAMPAPTPPA